MAKKVKCHNINNFWLVFFSFELSIGFPFIIHLISKCYIFKAVSRLPELSRTQVKSIQGFTTSHLYFMKFLEQAKPIPEHLKKVKYSNLQNVAGFSGQLQNRVLTTGNWQ